MIGLKQYIIDVEKWGKLRIGIIGWGLYAWCMIFGIGMLWFGNKLFVVLCLVVMFIAGQFVSVYKNWDKMKHNKTIKL